MKKLLLILFGLFTILYHAQGQHKVTSTFGKGINIIADDSTFTMKFASRFQALYETGMFESPSSGFSDSYSNMMIRRWRLKFDGYAINPKIVYKLEIGLSNRDLASSSAETQGAPNSVLDAVLKWNFHKGFTLWAGQTKLPGNRERVISSGDLQFVDRSLVNSLYNIDRDMGFQLHNKHKIGEMIVKEILAFSAGEGRGITVNNIGGFEYTGRMEFLPFGDFDSKGKDDYVSSALKRSKDFKLAIGATYDFNKDASRSRGNTGSFFKIENEDGKTLYGTADLSTLFIDIAAKKGNWSLLAEYADKRANRLATTVEGEVIGNFTTGRGVVGQIGYLFGKEINKGTELAGRITYIDSNEDSSRGDITQYTLGVSRYIVGHKLKVQMDTNYTLESNERAHASLRAMASFHF